MLFKRQYDNLTPFLSPNKVLVIYGPRRSGKTTILKNFLAKTKLKYRLDSGDNIQLRQILGSQDFSQIKNYASGYELIAIDEAQNIPNIGMGLKIIVDEIPGIKVIATGSSSFDLANKIGEPLTGRKRTIFLYPLSQMELSLDLNRFDLNQKLEEFLIFGSYPEIALLQDRNKKITALEELVNSYLFRDILALDKIKKSKKLVDLVKLLAFQVGSEVSLNELSTQLSLNVRTTERYLDLLEKSFVIISLGSFRRNLRNEILGKRKYYFLDNGVRNGIISQFNGLENRDDVGALWENFIFTEMIKSASYKERYANRYFWRTYDQKEIDFIEEREGKLFAYEFKWNDKAKPPKEFLETYPNTEFKTINKENYLDFIL